MCRVQGHAGVDGSARIQAIELERGLRLYGIVKAFGRRTDGGIVGELWELHALPSVTRITPDVDPDGDAG